MRRYFAVALLISLVAGCTPESARVPDDAVKAADDKQRERKGEENEEALAQANHAAVEMSETLRLVQETLAAMGGDWPQMQQVAQDFETGLREGRSNREALLEMLNALSSMQGQFEQRAREAESKLSAMRDQVGRLPPAAQNDMQARLQLATQQAMGYLADNGRLREALVEYKFELAAARNTIEQRDAEILEKQKRIGDQEAIIAKQKTTIDAYESEHLKRMMRIDTIAVLRNEGVLLGCRICAKKPNCGGCGGCEKGVVPPDGTFHVPAPIGKVEVFSQHPIASFSKVAVGRYQTDVKIIRDDFWSLSDCLLIGY